MCPDHLYHCGIDRLGGRLFGPKTQSSHRHRQTSRSPRRQNPRLLGLHFPHQSRPRPRLDDLYDPRSRIPRYWSSAISDRARNRHRRRQTREMEDRVTNHLLHHRPRLAISRRRKNAQRRVELL